MFSNLSCIQPLSFGFWVFWFKWIKNYHFQPDQKRAFDHHPVNTRCHNPFPHLVFGLKPLQSLTRDSNSWTISGYLHLLSIFPNLLDTQYIHHIRHVWIFFHRFRSSPPSQRAPCFNNASAVSPNDVKDSTAGITTGAGSIGPGSTTESCSRISSSSPGRN